jgi:2'-5' RNA ligase
MPRLFVALELPPEVQESLADLCHGVPRARWVELSQMHLTLRFVGEASDAQYHDILDALDDIDAPVFQFCLSGTGYFPPRGGPRTLWAGVAPCPALLKLQQRIEAALQAAGLPPEGRAFHPHVTLARFKDRVPIAPVAEFVASLNLFRSAAIAAREFLLFSSVLTGDGATHTCEATFPLGEGET